MSAGLSVDGPEPTRVRLLGLPTVNSIEDLAFHTRLSEKKIYQLWRRTPYQYRLFDIPKASGGTRRISHPSRDLKAVQAWILHTILRPLRPSRASVGFESGECILQNAQPHIGARVTMSMDIESFFPSVRANRVFVLFRWLGYADWTSSLLTTLCTLDGALPQGAPSSPKLANLVCLRLDRRIMGYVGRSGIAYTRYADDLTFSAFSQTALARATRFIRRIVESEGFILNEAKTRIAGPGRCHRATGLVISSDDAGIGRKTLRSIRARIHDLCAFDRASAPADRIAHLLGWLAFIRNVDPKRHRILCEYIRRLSARCVDSSVDLLLG
jgi:RNA-directed DNA polymerase